MGNFLSQRKYATTILKIFCMVSCKPMETPLAPSWMKENATSGEEVDDTIYHQLVGIMMYLVNTWLDMCYAVNRLSQVMVRLIKLYWKEAKHILWHLRRITQYILWYRQIEGVKLCGFTNQYWTGSPSDQNSTSRGIFSVEHAKIS